jgi:hypothetical protein
MITNVCIFNLNAFIMYHYMLVMRRIDVKCLDDYKDPLRSGLGLFLGPSSLHVVIMKYTRGEAISSVPGQEYYWAKGPCLRYVLLRSL